MKKLLIEQNMRLTQQEAMAKEAARDSQKKLFNANVPHLGDQTPNSLQNPIYSSTSEFGKTLPAPFKSP